MSPEEQDGMEKTYVLGSINPVPQAPDTITVHMRVLNVKKLMSRCFLAAVALKLEHFARTIPF
eukprot:1922939-Amphidinium_carterae.1